MKKIRMKEITSEMVSRLMTEARLAGDERTVADCIVVDSYLSSGLKRKRSSNAAKRVLRALNRAQEADTSGRVAAE